MGNSSVKLDRNHRANCIGIDDVRGSGNLDGDQSEVFTTSDLRVDAKITTYANLKRDMLRAAALSAMLDDVVGFRLEFQPIGKPSLAWAFPRMTYVKVKQIFKYAEAPPRITSVRGFYSLYLMLKDLYDSECVKRKESVSTEEVMAGEDGAEGASEGAALEEIGTTAEDCKKVAYLEENDPTENSFQDCECPICMDLNVEIVLGCGHAFCGRCHHDWGEISKTCPICRSEGSEEIWIVTNQEDCPPFEETVEKLMHGIHTYVLTLPRLEEKWERTQRLKRLQSSQSSRRSSTSTSEAPSPSRSINDDEEDELEEDEEPVSDFLTSSADYGISLGRHHHVISSDLPRDAFEEDAQLRLALALSVRNL